MGEIFIVVFRYVHCFICIPLDRKIHWSINEYENYDIEPHGGKYFAINVFSCKYGQIQTLEIY